MHSKDPFQEEDGTQGPTSQDFVVTDRTEKYITVQNCADGVEWLRKV